jgi:hypothetical protein
MFPFLLGFMVISSSFMFVELANVMPESWEPATQ